MKIAVGADHAGIEMKAALKEVFGELSLEVEDMGTDTPASVDYPDFGEKVARAVQSGQVERGVLVCGTGIGMSITANKISGIRAALVHDIFTARMSRLHNDANILVLGGRVLGTDLAKEIVRTWFTTPFEGDRHERRLQKIAAIEKKQ